MLSLCASEALLQKLTQRRKNIGSIMNDIGTFLVVAG